MPDKWEWDTFEAINIERKKLGIPPLTWCCAIESNTIGSCGGTIFHKFKVKRRVVNVTCPHWTQPQVIANMLLARDCHCLESNYKSGALILNNDNSRTYAIFAYGNDQPMSWEEMPKGNLCPYCHAGHEGDVNYQGHHPARQDGYEIEVQVWFCKRCQKMWNLPY